MLLRVSFRFTFLNFLSWSDGIIFLYICFPVICRMKIKNKISFNYLFKPSKDVCVRRTPRADELSFASDTRGASVEKMD